MAANRWAFLAPWWRVLQDHELLLTHTRCGLRERLLGLSVGIYPRPPSPPVGRGPHPRKASTQLPRVRDALELALLLAIVAKRAFEELLHEHTRADAREKTAAIFEALPDATLTHVELRVNTLETTQAVVDETIAALSVFLVPQPVEDHDPAFENARRQLLMQIPPSAVAKRQACERLKISVGLMITQQIAESMSPIKLLQIVEHADNAAATHQATHRFVIGRFKLDCKPSTMTPEAMALIHARHARGASIPFGRVAMAAGWSRLHLGQALAAVFQTESPAQDDCITSGYSSVSICEQSEREHFAQVCSALMHSRCVRSLTVSLGARTHLLDPARRRFHLRFIMFMLFSRWATHGIQRVDFEGIQFSHDDVEDFNQLLLCENPLPAIFNGGAFSADGSVPAKQVLVKKNARVRLSRKKRNSFTLSQATWFDVIEQLRDWFVFVPAYGKCRIRPGDVIRQRDMHAVSSVGSTGIKSVRFDAPSLRVGNSDGIFSILRRFGPQLEALAIRYASNEHADALVVLLASCPSLQRLHLPDANTRLLPHLLEAYETGFCTAPSLSLRHLVADPISQHLSRVFATLANPTQRMAKTVRELLVSVRGPDGPLGDEGAAIRTMLETNTVLECFERKCSPVHNEALIGQCRKFNNTTIGATPLSPRCKAAFLGVVSSDSALLSTVMQLDSVMIRRIFDMAAERVVRQVFVGSPW